MTVEAVRNRHALLFDIDLVYVAAKKIDVADHLADGIDDVGQVQIAGRDFVQHRREQKKVFTVYDRNFKARILPSFKFERGVKSAEAAAEDEHPCLMRHEIREPCVVA